MVTSSPVLRARADRQVGTASAAVNSDSTLSADVSATVVLCFLAIRQGSAETPATSYGAVAGSRVLTFGQPHGITRFQEASVALHAELLHATHPRLYRAREDRYAHQQPQLRIPQPTASLLWLSAPPPS